MGGEGGREEVGLLALGGHARRRASPLHVDTDERQFRLARQAQHFSLEGEAGPRGCGHRLLAGERRADRGADARDLVLGLKERASMLPDLLLEDLHDLRCRGDGIPSEEGAAGEEGGFRADLVAVADQGLDLGALGRSQAPLIPQGGCRGVLEARLEGLLVTVQDAVALLGELAADLSEDALGVKAEPPGHETQHHAVLRLVGAGCLHRQLLHGHGAEHDRAKQGERPCGGQGARLCLVNQRCAVAHGEFGAEPCEVLPVQCDGDRQVPAGIEDLGGPHAQTE